MWCLHVVDAGADEQIGWNCKQTIVGGMEIVEGALTINNNHQVRNRLKQDAVAPFALAKSLIDKVMNGDVGVGNDDPFVGPVRQWGDPADEPSDCSRSVTGIL